VHISWLRRKLGETAQHPRFLHTVRGVGIKLSPPVPPAMSEGHGGVALPRAGSAVRPYSAPG
jgi:hypothetical protein